MENENIVEEVTEEVMENNEVSTPDIPLPLIAAGAAAVAATGGLAYAGFKIWQKHKRPGDYYAAKQAKLQRKRDKQIEKAEKLQAKLDEATKLAEDYQTEEEVVEVVEVVETTNE